MKTFKKLYTALTVRDGEKKIIIQKVLKEGTKREFFSLEREDGTRVVSTMYARLYDAKAVALRLV